MTDYLLLFGGAFLAATLLPFYSELLLAGMLTAHPEQLFLLWLLASLGNTLGSVVNWVLGRYLLHFQDRRWFPVKAREMERAQDWFQRVGVWSLLLAWMPMGGDALTLIGGIMKIRLPLFVTLVFVGKSIRYLVVILMTTAVTA